MSEVFIPLGGAGGKNRGTVAAIGDNAPFSNAGAVMSLVGLSNICYTPLNKFL